MVAYRPSARRPIAGFFRRLAAGTTAGCVRWGVHPDVVSYLSIVASAVAALCFWYAARAPWLLLLAPAFCYVRLWLNMLDGMVALASGTASLRGEILNDLPDRVSDVVIFAGVAHSGLNSPYSAYWAAILALLTAYVGVFGQAVGVQRQFSGIMAKPWRMVALHGGAWVTLALLFRGDGIRFAGLTVLDWTCLVIVAGCVETIVVRLHRILHALSLKAT